MPARESETETAQTEAAPEVVAPAEPQAEQTTFSSEGDLPAVAQGDAAMTGPTASTLGFGGTQAVQADTASLDTGVHHWEEYKATADAAGKPEKWKDYYRAGHTEAQGWTNPWETRQMYEWDLKKGTSASSALQAWLRGPTIADYRAIGVAMDLDELRDEFGDRKFDALFGSANEQEDSAVPKAQRLRISAALYGVPLIDQMKAIAVEHDAREATTETETPVVEQAVEEKPKQEVVEQQPAIIAQELGLEQQDRELI